ncbi:MAG: hypothetical protein RIR00_2264 [Pseudomonadota bacterium]
MACECSCFRSRVSGFAAALCRCCRQHDDHRSRCRCRSFAGRGFRRTAFATVAFGTIALEFLAALLAPTVLCALSLALLLALTLGLTLLRAISVLAAAGLRRVAPALTTALLRVLLRLATLTALTTLHPLLLRPRMLLAGTAQVFLSGGKLVTGNEAIRHRPVTRRKLDFQFVELIPLRITAIPIRDGLQFEHAAAQFLFVWFRHVHTHATGVVTTQFCRQCSIDFPRLRYGNEQQMPVDEKIACRSRLSRYLPNCQPCWRPHGDSNPGYRRERAMS